MISQLPWICLGTGGWVMLNGILHTIAVINQHKGPYTRDFLRLLMDGLILITCGLIQVLCRKLIAEHDAVGYYIASTASVSLLIYCFLIFPFLKSIFTIAINFILLALLIAGYFSA